MTMKNTLSKFIIFVTGAAIGSAVTYKMVKDKYEKIANDEIESMREYFNQKYPNTKKKENAEEEYEESDEFDPMTLQQYEELVHDAGYVQYQHEKLKEEKGDNNVNSKPHVIPPEEFDENGYQTETLYYYADGTLATDCDEIVNNIDELVGEESLSHFGEYEDDSVFVRNDALQTDFEILKDRRKFSEIS